MMKMSLLPLTTLSWRPLFEHRCVLYVSDVFCTCQTCSVCVRRVLYVYVTRGLLTHSGENKTDLFKVTAESLTCLNLESTAEGFYSEGCLMRCSCCSAPDVVILYLMLKYFMERSLKLTFSVRAITENKFIFLHQISCRPVFVCGATHIFTQVL